MDSSHFLTSLACILNTATVMSCLFLKVPQIMNIVSRKSADGIYVQAMIMEITGFSIMMLYNYTNRYNVMTYLEYPIILMQVYVMMYFVLKYKNLLDMPIVPLGSLLYFMTVAAFALELWPKDILCYLVPFCTPLSGFAKLSYIYGIVQAANADAVSRTTWVISIMTNLARIFTVYVDSADKNLIFNFTISAILSSAVLFTTLYYQSATRECHDEREVSRRPYRKYSRVSYHSDKIE